MSKYFVIAATMLCLIACQKEKNSQKELPANQTIRVPAEIAQSNLGSDKYNTFYGPAVRIKEGFARSWINITHDNKPLALGIEMTQGTLHSEGTDGGHVHGNENILPLHQKAKELTPFDHINFNWSQNGHPPPGIYNVPHLDLHFYKMPLEERLLIPSYPEATAAFDLNPPAGFLPGGYIKSPGGEAKMGAHWMDVTSPEFQNQPFTHTLVYGSYNGKVTFYEPMVTISTLQSGATLQKEIRQPQHFDPVNTYYPTRYGIWKEGNRHYVAMEGMTWR